MDKKSLFWVSGAGSIFIYSTLIALIVMNFSNQARKVQLSGDSIAIDLLTQSQMNQQQMATPMPKETKEETIKEPQKTEAVEPTKNASEPKPEPTIDTAKNILKNFSKPAEPKPATQPVQPTTSQTNAKQLLSSLTLKKNSPSVTFSGGPGKSNEYLSRIAGIIKSGWNPYKSDVGLSAIIYVSIKSDGSFDFSIKKQSQNGDFNARLNAYLTELKSKPLPPPDDGKPVSVEFNFIAKE